MKKAILLLVLCCSFGINAAENGPVFQPTTASDFLNITGATALAVVKSAVAVGAFSIFCKSILEMCEGKIAGGALQGVVSYILAGIALRLDDNQRRCTLYTSRHLKPLSEGLQTLASLVAFAGITGRIVQDLQQD